MPGPELGARDPTEHKTKMILCSANVSKYRETEREIIYPPWELERCLHPPICLSVCLSIHSLIPYICTECLELGVTQNSGVPRIRTQ